MALDWRWVQIVGLGMIIHYADMCILGFCTTGEPNKPNITSLIFVFATLNLLTTQNLCPCVVANLNPYAARLFEVAASLLIADVMHKTVWLPLARLVVLIPALIGSVVQCISTSFCVVETAPVKYMLATLAPENSATNSFAVLFTALLLAVWSAQSNDLFCQLSNLGKGDAACPCPGEEACKQNDRSRSRVRHGLSVSEFEPGE